MNTSLIRARARENLRDNWSLSVGTALLAAILGGLHTSSTFNLELEEDLLNNLPTILLAVFLAVASIGSTLNLAKFIVGGTVQLGYSRYLLDQHDRKELSVKLLFSQFDRFGQGFLQSFLRGLYTALWTLLFIIPGIMKSLSYAMTPFIMADHPEMTASEGIKASMELMEGHKADLFILELSFLGWVMLNVLTLGIGSFWLNPYMNAAYAAFYREIQAQEHDTSVE